MAQPLLRTVDLTVDFSSQEGTVHAVDHVSFAVERGELVGLVGESGYGRNPYGVEWVRFDDDAPYPDLIKTVAHVAFEVDDLAEALEGKRVIIEPNSPSPGVLVAFIEDNGAPIELMQIDPAGRSV